MKRPLLKPPAGVSVRSNQNDYGPIVQLTHIIDTLRCYFLSKPSRLHYSFPAASLLKKSISVKVESLGECSHVA